jgi:hypothetical protein
VPVAELREEVECLPTVLLGLFEPPLVMAYASRHGHILIDRRLS